MIITKEVRQAEYEQEKALREKNLAEDLAHPENYRPHPEIAKQEEPSVQEKRNRAYADLRGAMFEKFREEAKEKGTKWGLHCYFMGDLEVKMDRADQSLFLKDLLEHCPEEILADQYMWMRMKFAEANGLGKELEEKVEKLFPDEKQ